MLTRIDSHEIEPMETTLDDVVDSSPPRHRCAILEHLVEFERSHDVARYRIADWCAWPFLRTSLATAAEQRDSSQAPGESFGTLPRFARRVRRNYRKAANWTRPYVVDRANSVPLGTACDVVFLTSSDRRQFINGRWHHPLADSLQSFLAKHSIRSNTWECGVEIGPRAKPTTWISRRMSLRQSLRRVSGDSGTLVPEWFPEVAAFAADALGVELKWPVWRHRFEFVDGCADVYQRWLRRTKCRGVMIDCWYNWQSMGLCLAAHRLGLPTIEFQHGLQGNTHPAYSNWHAGFTPGEGIVPSTFWTWGIVDANVLQSSNVLSPQTIVGGNLWLNSWREGDAFSGEIARAGELIDGAEKSILVTMQPVVGLNLIEQAIKLSPSGWKWLIRLHPRAKNQLDEFAKRLGPYGKTAHDMKLATELPLYALLRSVDVHATGFSTCALESLALGTPTVVFDRNGKDAFGNLIDRGHMRYAPSAEQLVASIAAERKPQPALSGGVQEYFASENAGQALRKWLAAAEKVK